MDDGTIVQHLIEIKTGQAALTTEVSNLKTAVVGNGQPGLTKRVDDLENKVHWVWGVGAAITSFLGWIGWEHIGRHK